MSVRNVTLLTRAMASMATSSPRSPTLSDMEFDGTDSGNGTTNVVLGQSAPRLPGQGTQVGTMKRLTRYLPADGRDAFIGPLPPTAAVSLLPPYVSLWAEVY